MNSVERYQVARGRNGSWEVRCRQSNRLVSLQPSLAGAQAVARRLNYWAPSQTMVSPALAPLQARIQPPPLPLPDKPPRSPWEV